MLPKAFLLFLIIFCLSVQGYSQETRPENRDTIVYTLFNKKVNILSHSFGTGPNINFLVLHDDENTGAKAAYEFIQLNGGRMVELAYGDKRYVEFKTKETRVFKFDPNRIFSVHGIDSTLKTQSGFSTRPMIDSIQKFADSVLKVYGFNKTPDYIITLHNNTDNSYSITSYTPGRDLKIDAAEVYINNSMDPDDMVIVTEKTFFNYLRDQGINTVLQSNQPRDDGSLSVYATNNKIPYINIEVQHGHIDEHRRLIEAVAAMLKDMESLKTAKAVN